MINSQFFKMAPMTLAISLLSVILFAMLSMGGIEAVQPLLLPSVFVPGNLIHWLNVITPCFVHYNLFHLSTNVVMLWLFCAQIERHSKILFGLFFIWVAAISNMAEWLAAGPKFGGLSGIVYGGLGYVWVMQRAAVKYDYQLDTVLTIIVLLSIPLAATGLFGQYSNYAHGFGLLSGAGLGKLTSTFLSRG